MYIINDPIDHTHRPASGDHHFHGTFVLFRDILKTVIFQNELIYDSATLLYQRNTSLANIR